MVRLVVMVSVLVFAGMALVGCRAEVEKASTQVSAAR